MLRKQFILCLLIGSMCAGAALSQTSDFTYQGRLINSSLPAGGVYEFELRLYDALAGGNLLGTRMREALVTNGIFTVRLDFPPALFDGSGRFLEISVRTGGSPDPFTVLSPRQPITSAPYSIRSLNAAQLGGIDANQYVVTTDSRMTDARNPLPNSTNYVQNATSQQAASNFNISGNGTLGGTLSANAVNATTQYNLNGNRILSNPGTANLFAGVGAGSITTAGNNAFFGRNAGNQNTTGNGNSFIGNNAGSNNNDGDANSFLGNGSGSANTTGDSNTFLGNTAGNANTTGSNNTVIGAGADLGGSNYIFATAIGAGAVAAASNTITLGRNAGEDDVRITGTLRVVSASGSIVLAVANPVAANAICRNSISGLIGSCSSSLRFKTDTQPFLGGLNLVNHLRPITFNWRDGGLKDVGFAAEDVEKIEPLLVTYNSKNEIEGVKYAQITTVLVNAVKEQQAQIKRQQKEIDALKKLVCETNPAPEVCKEK